MCCSGIDNGKWQKYALKLLKYGIKAGIRIIKTLKNDNKNRLIQAKEWMVLHQSVFM